MKNLKTILSELTPVDRQFLFLAFEHGMSKLIMLDCKRFIGVNYDGLPNVIVHEKQGDFILGEFQ